MPSKAQFLSFDRDPSLVVDEWKGLGQIYGTKKDLPAE